MERRPADDRRDHGQRRRRLVAATPSPPASLFVCLLVVVVFLVVATSVAGTTSVPATQKVLVLDIDGTVYDDDNWIETQIRDNCHAFALEGYGYDAQQAQELHVRYGSTIRGICEHGQPRAVFRDYYNEVYPGIDMSRLRRYSFSGLVSGSSTGYGSAGHADLRRCLDALHRVGCPVVVASNSPVFHVKRVLTRLGLATLDVAAYLTPERRGGVTKNEPAFWDPLFALYPREQYTCCLIDDNGSNVQLVRALGMRALRITPRLRLPEALVHFLDVLPVHPTERNGTRPEDEPWFDFDEVAYLRAKNRVDDASFNPQVRARLATALQQRVGEKRGTGAGAGPVTVTVVDVGAGLLNMLDHVHRLVAEAAAGAGGSAVRLTYVAFENNGNLLPAVEERLVQGLGLARSESGSFDGAVRSFSGSLSPTLSVTVHLCAVDFMSEAALRVLTQVLAHAHRAAGGGEGGSGTKRRALQVPPRPGTEEPTYTAATCVPVDLIVGCCVADLTPPTALAAQLTEVACDDGPLLYLPITFAGQTRLERGGAGGGEPTPAPAATGLPVPSDGEVFQQYHEHLRAQGHHLQPLAPHPSGIVDALAHYGCSVLTHGVSDWRIARSAHPHMWRCMLRFVALGTALAGLGNWDARAWVDGVLRGGDSAFVASNIDVLAAFPRVHEHILPPPAAPDAPLSADALGDSHRVRFGAPPPEALRLTPSTASAGTGPSPTPWAAASPRGVPTSRRAVEFTGPRGVRVVEEPTPVPGPTQLLLRTLCSLVSTGTELKVFTGDVDTEQPADTTIAGLAQESLAYPLRYGYSLVGEVVAAGDAVPDAQRWLGRRVFAFAPHASAVVVDAGDVMPVPAGVRAEDAVFLPSVETAVSLAHAAGPLLGERVLVVGQGLIGLLTAAALQHAGAGPAADVTVADVSDARLAVASAFNPTVATWNPAARPTTSRGGFDVCVEVSGNPRGLQTAIDCAAANGKVVVGSLFGDGLSPLRLGLRFHRSGVRLVASQVSHIPPELSGRWDKRRRFDVAWHVLQKVRPSRLLGADGAVPLRSADVLRAYERLERGEQVTALFVDSAP